MAARSLAEIVARRPYPEFADWWPMGDDFLACMATAIVSEWQAVAGSQASLQPVIDHTRHYLQTVYGRQMRPDLVLQFAQGAHRDPVQSGEFDGLSYAFFRAAFAILATAGMAPPALQQARREFTRRVGRRFFACLERQLHLSLPDSLTGQEDVRRLEDAIEQVGHFLSREGYLRDHFAFRFDVRLSHQGRLIDQAAAGWPVALERDGVAYALYEMGYPAILPSAVYLYHTVGEAQHHSSRTIEELFRRVGLEARETADFDPIGFPSDRVVELWEIRP